MSSEYYQPGGPPQEKKVPPQEVKPQQTPSPPPDGAVTLPIIERRADVEHAPTISAAGEVKGVVAADNLSQYEPNATTLSRVRTAVKMARKLQHELGAVVYFYFDDKQHESSSDVGMATTGSPEEKAPATSEKRVDQTPTNCYLDQICDLGGLLTPAQVGNWRQCGRLHEDNSTRLYEVLGKYNLIEGDEPKLFQENLPTTEAVRDIVTATLGFVEGMDKMEPRLRRLAMDVGRYGLSPGQGPSLDDTISSRELYADAVAEGCLLSIEQKDAIRDSLAGIQTKKPLEKIGLNQLIVRCPFYGSLKTTGFHDEGVYVSDAIPKVPTNAVLNIDGFNPRASERKSSMLILRTDLREVPEIQGRRMELGRVVENLISNAVKGCKQRLDVSDAGNIDQPASDGTMTRSEEGTTFSGSNKYVAKVFLTTKTTKDGWAEIEVSDNGVGIDLADPHLIAQGVKIPNDISKLGVTSQTSGTGHGTGTTFCREEIESIGGTIDWESKGKLKGTKVTIRIPPLKEDKDD